MKSNPANLATFATALGCRLSASCAARKVSGFFPSQAGLWADPYRARGYRCPPRSPALPPCSGPARVPSPAPLGNQAASRFRLAVASVVVTALATCLLLAVALIHGPAFAANLGAARTDLAEALGVLLVLVTENWAALLVIAAVSASAYRHLLQPRE
jgi:hypothetical protein